MSTALADQVIVPARYNGPARSGNGGYVSGLLAHELRADHTVAGDRPEVAVAVSLRQPPPLDVPLHVTREEPDSASLTFGGARDRAGAARAARDLGRRAGAVRRGVGRVRALPRTHLAPVPHLLRLRRRPARRPAHLPRAGHPDRRRTHRRRRTLDSRPDVAADYHEYDEPGQRACLAATWAALDCIGGWAGDLGERLMVLGRMTAVVDDLPLVGEPHVVMGQALGQQGRKTFTASTLYDPDGRIVGRAEHVWVAVDPDVFNQLLDQENA